MEIRERDEYGNLKPPINPFGKETEKETIARLEQEKQMLMSSMMEMSSYMAMQEQRLKGQENAIMELSTLIAMSLSGGGSDV